MLSYLTLPVPVPGLGRGVRVTVEFDAGPFHFHHTHAFHVSPELVAGPYTSGSTGSPRTDSPATWENEKALEFE